MFSMEARLDNLFYFPFWFTLDNVRWRSFVIWTVSLGLAVASQKVDVEDGVNLHGWRKGQAIGHRGQFPIDKEWSVTAGCQLCGWVMGLQVASFEPHLFTFFEVDWDEAFF